MIALGLINEHTDPGLPAGRPLDDAKGQTPLQSLPADTLDSSGDPLEAFASESDDPGTHVASVSVSANAQSSPGAGRRAPWVILVLVTAAGVGVAALALVPRVTGSLLTVTPPPIIGPGLVYVESEPAGAEVWMNGVSLGLTPLRLSLADGHEVLELRHAGVVRRVPLSVERGQILRHRVEFVDVPSSDIPVALVERAEPSPTAARNAEVPLQPVPSTALYPIVRVQPAAVAESATTAAGSRSFEAAPAVSDDRR